MRRPPLLGLGILLEPPSDADQPFADTINRSNAMIAIATP